jgi:uncharacterized RDD family membrane protein YckC
MEGSGWHPDPSGQHELRYWDGQTWTDHVSDGGQQSTEPIPPPPPGGVPAPQYGGVAQYGQATAWPLSSRGKRFGAYLLDVLLVIVTLVIGWIVWSIIIWKYGQSPGKSILKMRCIKTDTSRCATRGDMALREIVGKVVLGIIPLYWLVDNGFILFDQQYQAIHDKLASTVVVDDPEDRYAPAL